MKAMELYELLMNMKSVKMLEIEEYIYARTLAAVCAGCIEWLSAVVIGTGVLTGVYQNDF